MMDNSARKLKGDTDIIEREVFLRVVGNRVRQLRHKKQWTQEALAQEAGINDKYVYDIENGRKCMSIWILEKIANALEVDAAEIVGDLKIQSE